MNPLDIEYKFYKSNQKELLQKYKDKILVIKGEKVEGVYDDEATAYQEAIKKFDLGSFLIQKCIPEEENIQTFHSNVRGA